ncbi:MAG: hypothetical protein WC108_04135 [Bacteroidales bacterium]|jgi:NADH:ubiquinone oxidoreductase subunit 6 (subunit J)|nr:hypothetical protein [Bacteroidales bacterium]MDD4001856.1 hypothetical protein [Bacteroidales bacterium]MDD4528903.1 hypothetical protein [Bacteroidales bacterium]MDD4828953.1 hypothetical protein [Bacteroidales bacterium]
MKKDFKKIYWTIIIIWGAIASLTTVLYSVFFENTSLAQLFWNLSYWTVVIFISISIISALGFALGFIIRGFIDDPKKQMGIIIAVGALVVVFVGSYLLSSGEDVSKDLFEKTGSNFENSKLIGASLYMVYVLLFGVIVTALYSEVAKKIK